MRYAGGQRTHSALPYEGRYSRLFLTLQRVVEFSETVTTSLAKCPSRSVTVPVPAVCRVGPRCCQAARNRYGRER